MNAPREVPGFAANPNTAAQMPKIIRFITILLGPKAMLWRAKVARFAAPVQRRKLIVC
jgi:hypothetical protein